MTDTKAVIVAAGASLRLRPLTDAIPKCFLPVGGRPLIEYSLDALKACGIDRIAFVVGFLKDEFPARLGDRYEYIYNPFYATTNNMASLWFAKDFVKGSDFAYIHSDLLYHPAILAEALASDAEISLAVEKTACDEEMMKVRVDGDILLESSKEIAIEEAFGEWTGIAKFSERGWEKCLVEIEALLAAGRFNDYDTAAMNRLARKEAAIRIVSFEERPFIEIDFPDDLAKAETLVSALLPST